MTFIFENGFGIIKPSHDLSFQYLEAKDFKQTTGEFDAIAICAAPLFTNSFGPRGPSGVMTILSFSASERMH